MGKLIHNEATPIVVMWPHLHNFTTATQSKGQWVKFYYWSCDLTEHNKALDWLYVQQYVTKFCPRQRCCLMVNSHLPKEM